MQIFTKRLLYTALCTLLLTLSFHSSRAQLYGNEWIDYSKIYYKFKVGANGIFRITKSALTLAGVPSSVQGSNFILYRDGQEVPVYTSTSAALSTNDYIEFYGKGPDGFLDKELYANPSYQGDDRISLFSDTACYYLSFDNASGHLRYSVNTTPIPSSTPPGAFHLEHRRQLLQERYSARQVSG